MTPTDKIPVTLQAQQWEAIMHILSDAPYRVSAPLISEIQNQCIQQQRLSLVPRDEQPAAE
jgi:hypothetical protein